MADLSTSYMGVELKSPVVVGACTLSGMVDQIKKMEAHGAGACVVKASSPVVLTTQKGRAKTLLARNAPRRGRATQGQEIIALRGQDVVSDAFTPLPRLEASHDK